MKPRLCSMIVAAAFTLSAAAEISPRFEIGAMLGEPTGLSAKYWLSERNAIDGVAAWAFGEDGRLDLHADYLFHPFSFSLSEGELPVYFGAGGVAWFRDDWFAGVRIPVGASYLFDNLPLSLFGEIAPQVELAPETDFNLAGGVGVRLAF